MKLKNMLSTLALGFTLAATTVCGAEGVSWLSPSDLALGYLQPGMTMQQIEAVYGPAKEVSTHYIDHAYGYGDDSVKLVPSSDGTYIKSIIVKKDNGWATPAGVTVGMDVSVIQKIYGTGAAKPVRHKAHHMPGYDYYTYWQAGDTSTYLTFAAKDGKIAYIKVGRMEH